MNKNIGRKLNQFIVSVTEKNPRVFSSRFILSFKLFIFCFNDSVLLILSLQSDQSF